MSWAPGTRVQWTPLGPAASDYDSPISGTVADAPSWPPLDRLWCNDARIPVDLDSPLTIWPPSSCGRHDPCHVTRLYVRAPFLEPYQAPAEAQP